MFLALLGNVGNGLCKLYSMTKTTSSKGVCISKAMCSKDVGSFAEVGWNLQLAKVMKTLLS